MSDFDSISPIPPQDITSLVTLPTAASLVHQRSVRGLILRMIGISFSNNPNEDGLRDKLRVLMHTMQCAEKDQENMEREDNGLPLRHRRCQIAYCPSRKAVLKEHIEKCTGTYLCLNRACWELRDIHKHWKDCQSFQCQVCGPVMAEFAEQSTQYYAPIPLRLGGSNSMFKGYNGDDPFNGEIAQDLREHLQKAILNAMIRKEESEKMTKARLEYLTKYSEMIEGEAFERVGEEGREVYFATVALKIDTFLKEARGLAEYTRPWQSRLAPKKRHNFIIRIFSALLALHQDRQEPETRIHELLVKAMMVEESHYFGRWVCEKEYCVSVNKCIRMYRDSGDLFQDRAVRRRRSSSVG